MIKILEDYMWNNIYHQNDFGKSTEYLHFPRDVIKKMLFFGMIKSEKQAHRTLEKWITKGIYEYGCCLDLGWKIEKRNRDYP